MVWIECKQQGTTGRLKLLLQDQVGCRPDNPSVNSLYSDSRSQILCGFRPTQAQGRKVRSDQSPETRGNGGVEREFDLANTDGSAGVRNSREKMEVAEGG